MNIHRINGLGGGVLLGVIQGYQMMEVTSLHFPGLVLVFAALVWTRIKLSTSLVDVLWRRLQLT